MPTMCKLRSNFLYTLRPVLLAAFLTVCSVLAHATVVHDSIVSVDAFILQFNDTVATRKHCVFSCVGALQSFKIDIGRHLAIFKRWHTAVSLRRNCASLSLSLSLSLSIPLYMYVLYVYIFSFIHITLFLRRSLFSSWCLVSP